MARETRLDRTGPQPSQKSDEKPEERREPQTRAERFAEGQKLILATYAETFRRLAK